MEVSQKPSVQPNFSKLSSKMAAVKVRPEDGTVQGKRRKTRGVGGNKGQGHTEGRKKMVRVPELKRASDGDGSGGEGGADSPPDTADDVTRVMEELEKVLRKDGVVRPCESLSWGEVLDRANEYIKVLLEMEREDRSNHCG